MLVSMQVDWQAIVADLRAHGLSTKAISRQLKGYVSEPQIRAYEGKGKHEGKESAPGHFRGELLLKLWIETCGKSRDQAPMRPASLRSHPSARAFPAEPAAPTEET